MVCVTRSSSKNEEGEAVDAVPPVRTRGRASSGRKTTTRRSRLTHAAEDKSDSSKIPESLEETDSGSPGSTESRSTSVSSNPLPSTPSRRSRKKRTSEAEDDGNPTNTVDLHETSSGLQNAEQDEQKDSEPRSVSASNTPSVTSAKPPSTPSRRRRGSSSSSQTAPLASPARITRAMRRAGISTPKDVVELDIVVEEPPNESQSSEHPVEEREVEKSPIKSPVSREAHMSPTKESITESTGEEMVVPEKETHEIIASPTRKRSPKSDESLVPSLENDQPANDLSSPSTGKSSAKKPCRKDIASPNRQEFENVEEVCSSPKMKSPVKDAVAEEVDASESVIGAKTPNSSPSKASSSKEVPSLEGSLSEEIDVEERLCSPIRNSPVKEVSPVKMKEVSPTKTADKESLDFEMEQFRSPKQKSLSASPGKNSPITNTSPVKATTSSSLDMEVEPSSPTGNVSGIEEKISGEEVVPENLNFEAELVLSRIITHADEATPVKTTKAEDVDLKKDLLRSPTKKSPVTEDSPGDVICVEETDIHEEQCVVSPLKRSPEKVSSPVKNLTDEMLTGSPVRKSPRNADATDGFVSPPAQRKEKSIDECAPEDESVTHMPTTQVGKISPMKPGSEADHDDVIAESSPGHQKSPLGLFEPDTSVPVPGEESVKKPLKKKSEKASKKSAEPEPTIEDEEDQPSCQDGEKYVELESFKKLFKRPKYHKKEFARSISALYTYASKLETRKNDLPTEILSNDVETVWQFIAFRSKQISKEFRKRFGLFDIDLKLHKEAESSEDESEDQDENEDEELNENDEEEEEVDLLNLKDEDLKDLEREMDEMREEENEKEPEQDENTAPRKKYPKSVVDDKFFSLAEMNAFLDEQDRQEGAETDILDTADDSWTGTADYCYEDFFGKKDIAEEPIKGKEKKLKKRTRTKDSDKSAKKSKTFRFAMDEAEPEIEGEANGLMEEEEQTPVLLGDTEEPQQQETKLKRSLKRLKETIKKLEAENLAPRSWEMSGEVTAQQRGENELLETHLQFDHGIKKAPEITEVFTEKLEELIKQRIKDKVFDDVVRKKRIEERSEPYRNQAIEEREMVKTSLAEVYEKEYQKAVGENKANNEVNEEHAAIDKQMRELFRLIDALSNFDYTPPEVKPEVRVVSNMAALRVEEVGMSASTDAQLLAPEEMKKRQKGDLKGDDERNRTDKLRQRRKKKNRQRAMVELFGEEKAMEGLKKKKKKKVDEDTSSSGGEKLKSAAFFSKLQETVRNEIREKTTKKKKISKVKSEQVSVGGSKYML
ncbi:hypothetical protein RB195_008728 [Necator americanus]|uniref:Mpp10 protein n=1 Tax=Necator americanus TaxID=51031 RepID=A0ABR1CQU5_NECAM